MQVNEAVLVVEKQLAHAWVLRAFLRRCEEVEQQFPELLEVGRVIFDVARAIESARQRRGQEAMLRTLRRRLGALKAAAQVFQKLGAQIQVHTHLTMASLSFQAVVEELERVVHAVGREPESGEKEKQPED